MEINIVCRHLDLTDGIRNHVHARMQKLKRFASSVSLVNVTLSFQKKYIYVAEVFLVINKEPVKAFSEEEDMYIAIDKAIEKVRHRLQKIYDKRKSHKAVAIKEKAMLCSEDVPNDVEDVIKSIMFQSVEVKPMDIQEAILQYNALDREFLFFEHIDTKKINFLRRNSNGKLEIIEILT